MLAELGSRFKTFFPKRNQIWQNILTLGSHSVSITASDLLPREPLPLCWLRPDLHMVPIFGNADVEAVCPVWP